MPENSWTIGSDSSCDLVVDSNTVSGHHCRLTRDGNEWSLTDLNSTNGTYINGQQLVGSRNIKATDTITLGQTLPMPWPAQVDTPANLELAENALAKRKDTSATTLDIGRGSENDIVLSDSNVSTNHARLIIDGSEIVIEDLGSTNGTSINKVENKISRSAVIRTDTVFFGSTPYLVSDLLHRSTPSDAATRIEPGNVARSDTASASRLITMTVSGIGLLMTIWGIWFFSQKPDATSTTQVNQSNQAEATDSVRTPPEPEVPARKQQAVPVDTPQNLTETNTITTAMSPEDAFARAVFLIVCADDKRETPFRVGTGFAIDANTIVTTASVIRAMRSLQQNGYPTTFLFSPADGNEFDLGSVVIHPQFEVAEQRASKARRAHDAIYDQLESQPPEPETFESVKDRMVAARVEAMEAMDQQASFDVAIINTTKSIQHWLPGASPDASLRPKQKITVTGYAFDVEDPFFDRDVPFELSTMASRVGKVVRGPESPGRMLAQGNAEQYEYAYLGSPVLNTQGQVVGVYSRPTPPEIETEANPETLFDAALFKRVLECRRP